MKVAAIPADATFSTVQTMAQEASGVDKSTMKLLAGFPPQALSLEPDSAITGVVQTGDTIVIEGSAPVVDMTPAEAAEIISSSPAQPKRKRQRKQGALFKSEAGIAEQMVAAGGGKDQSDDLGVSYLRDAFKFAMSHAQSETLANFRYKAALSGKYEFVPVQAFRLGDSTTGQYDVKFKGERAWKQDDAIELIEQDALRAVYQMVLAEGGEAAREHLKPFKMAQISPRCFWSLVHHFNGDVQQGLQTLLPEHDWNFLNERAKKLSEKAQRNKDQLAQTAALKLEKQRQKDGKKRKNEQGS